MEGALPTNASAADQYPIVNMPLPETARRAYTHGVEYWYERVEMMQAWADYLDELRAAGKVIRLRRAGAGSNGYRHF